MPECDAAVVPAHLSTGFSLTHHSGLYPKPWYLRC
jgi:hypothetical protein